MCINPKDEMLTADSIVKRAKEFYEWVTKTLLFKTHAISQFMDSWRHILNSGIMSLVGSSMHFQCLENWASQKLEP